MTHRVTKQARVTITDTQEKAEKPFGNFLKSEYLIRFSNYIYLSVFIATLADTVISFIKSVVAIVSLNAYYLNMPWYVLIIKVLTPAATWVLSTLNEEYKFRKRKILIVTLVLVHSVVVIWQVLLQGTILIVASLMLYIPIDGSVKPSVVVYFAYYIIGMIYTFSLFLALMSVYANTNEQLTRDRIYAFFLEDYFSEWKIPKRFSYNLEFIRYLNTGKTYTISMRDRFLHTLGIGSTGTGKTSSCITVAIEHDLDIIASNTDTLKRKMVEWYEKGHIRMKHEMSDEDFSLSNFEGVGEHKDKWDSKIKKLEEKIPIAGITVMCPNSSLADDVWELTVAKGISHVNRIDPVYDRDGALKPGSIGMNPLYVNPIDTYSSEELYLEKVVQVANRYAEVNQAVFEASAKSDPYFSGLNKNITINASIVMIIGVPLVDKRKATISDVQRVINNFTAIKDYRDAVVLRFGNVIPGQREPDKRLGHANVCDTLKPVIDRIDIDFLGDNAKELNKQATGLRNIIDSSISIPRIKKILTSEYTIDFDKILADSEVTIINFDIGLGEIATAFGLFFMLNFINSVLGRPKESRPPHFFYVDEAHVLFHPRMELCSTLFRQYNVGCMFFMQALAQLDKNELTKYMKNVFTGNMAHQLVFGRAGNEEMKYYSAIGGTQKNIETETSIRETALSMQNTSLTTSISQSVVDEDKVSMNDIRYRRFLECTVFSTRHNMVLDPFIGKVNFLDEAKKKKISRFMVSWDEMMDDDTIRYEQPETLVSITTDRVFRTTTESDDSDHTSYRNALPSGMNPEFTIECTKEEPENPANADQVPNIPKKYVGGLLTGKNTMPKAFNPPEEDIPGNAGTESGKPDLLIPQKPYVEGVDF